MTPRQQAIQDAYQALLDLLIEEYQETEDNSQALAIMEALQTDCGL